jgi:4-hydroxybenzoate polyprenyltransferase
MTFAKLLQLSRPRFWIYVFGPYLVGLAAGVTSRAGFLTWPVLVFGLFFLLPANLLIYGVNDIYDYETDRNNAKKVDYESLVAPHEQPALWRAIALANIPFGLIFLLALSLGRIGPPALLAMAAFLFFSLFYSVPPIRAKARPILDSAFNVLYICPGIMAYSLAGGQALSPRLVLAAWCWAMAMHAYSAVPDISADRGAGLSTVATLLGFRGTIFGCLLLYALSGALSFSTLGALALALGAVYIALMLVSLTRTTETDLFRVYRIFPLINALSGAALFFSVLLGRPGIAR